jgi:hypothetical protein
MRRILVATTILAAACGGKSTIMATAEIKASATQAQSGMGSASTNTQASIGLQGIGSDVGGAAAAGDVSTVDLSTGLPDPAQLAAAALAPSSGSVHQALRLPGTSNAATTIPVGCVRRDPGTSSPTLVAPGPQCAADTYLEVDYDNGDVVKVTWSETTTSFSLKFEVIAGPWKDTNLQYSGNLNGNSATVSVTGAMQFSRTGSVVHVDADFNVTYAVSFSQSSNGTTVNISVNGTATDHIALVRAREQFGLSMQDATSGQTTTTTVNWNGSVGVDLLKADGVTIDHSVTFNVNATVTTQSSGTGSGSATWSLNGHVEYDGAVAGNLVTKNNQVYIDWTDSTEEAFDPSVLALQL